MYGSRILALSLALVACDAPGLGGAGQGPTPEQITAFHESQLRPLVSAAAASLHELGRPGMHIPMVPIPTARVRAAKRAELRLYLLLTGPREAGEPGEAQVAAAILAALAERDERPLDAPARAAREVLVRAWVSDPARLRALLHGRGRTLDPRVRGAER